MNNNLNNPEKLLIDISNEIVPILHFNSLIPAKITFISEINSNGESVLWFSNSFFINNIALSIIWIGISINIFFSDFDSKKIVMSTSASFK